VARRSDAGPWAFFSRPGRGALGLRGRIVGAVLVTTVATLAVAALALLGPLEQELRNAALHTLEKDVHGKSATGDFADLSLLYLGDPKLGVATELRNTERSLATRIGSGTYVTVLGYPDRAGRGTRQGPPLPSESDAGADTYSDATGAFLSHRTQSGFETINGTEYARLAIPFKSNGLPFVLAVRKPIGEINDAVHVVRSAFLIAAIAGLALTLILGIPLAATLVRRLRRLRQAALELAEGSPELELPPDRARDEVGDLSRAFTIMRERLLQQEEARRTFVATASHELRTPLTSLEGMLELLDEDLHDIDPDLADARALLARARVQSRRLGRLAADLLDLSRIDTEVRLRSEPVELGELSRAVMAEFELGTAARGLSPVLDDSSGPVWAHGDPGSVARILRILLENAVRLSPDNSEIRVELRNGRHALVRVCDQGPGVPEEERDLIFQRFQRGRQTGGAGGFGLGLAIGRELAERMGGELVLERQDGPGATFALRLPVARAPDGEPLLHV
jgi:signal transduction histidine kinase